MTGRQAGRHTGRKTYRQTDRQTDRQTNKQTGRKVDRHVDTLTYRQTDTQVDRQPDRPCGALFSFQRFVHDLSGFPWKRKTRKRLTGHEMENKNKLAHQPQNEHNQNKTRNE